jgi:hypothetical protein
LSKEWSRERHQIEVTVTEIVTVTVTAIATAIESATGTELAAIARGNAMISRENVVSLLSSFFSNI